MQEDQPVISVHNLHISFAGDRPFTAVDGISFDAHKGKTLAIVGESGSGKSLTALSLMGLLPAAASMNGDLMLSARNTSFSLNDIGSKKWQTLRGKEVGMVFQEPMSSLNPIMSIGKQLAETIITHQNISKSEAKLVAIDWLNKVQLPMPEKLYDRFPHQLSGGQKQRVMIAMAMCNHPVLLIADEPTTALDVTVQQEIIRLMAYLQQEHNTAMVFITHDLALAAIIADEVLVMYQGKVVEYGIAEQVLRTPQHAYTQALLACKPSVQDKGERLLTVADFMGNNTAKIVNKRTLSPVIQIGTQLLFAEHVRVWFPENRNMLGTPTSYFKAVDDISFTINKGEVLGLVGESGCGKSTLSRALVGLLPVHDGSIVLNDEQIADLPVKEWTRIRRQVQMIFQDPYSSLNPRMTVGDAIIEPMLFHNIVTKAQAEKEALRLLDIVQLPADSLGRYPHQFSGGQRQRIGIARALALKPQLLICDESVSALDVSIQAQILNLLKDLQQEFSLTYLFISHDLSVVHYISDRVMVMQAGKIVESGTADEVLKHPKNMYTRKLIDAMPKSIS